MNTSKKEIQQALKLIEESKIKEAIDLLFSTGYSKEALELMKKLTENTTYEDIITQELVSFNSFKRLRLGDEITEIDLQNKISAIHRKINQIIPTLDITEIPDFSVGKNEEKEENVNINAKTYIKEIKGDGHTFNF